MSPGPNDHRLSCGASAAELLDQVAAGRAGDRNAHQQGCPHCVAALAEYERLWAPVREVAAAEVRAPDSLLEDAIRRIRGAASDPTYGSLSSPTGTTRVSARVVVVTARETAQDIAGVRVVLSRLVTAGVIPRASDGGDAVRRAADGGPPHDEGLRVVAGVAGRSTAIEVTLAADYGVDLVDLGDRIRREVADRVKDVTGLDPVAVTVRIDDVLD